MSQDEEDENLPTNAEEGVELTTPTGDPHRGAQNLVPMDIEAQATLVHEIRRTPTATTTTLPPHPSSNPHRRDHHYSQSTVDSERDVDFDRDVLHRGVRDAGRWAYGTILVEVWVWNDRGTHMIRPPGGWWLDPIFHVQQHEQLSQSGLLSESTLHHGISTNSHCPLCRLTDPNLTTFEPPRPLTLGEGIPGALWEELQHQGKIKAMTSHGAHNQSGNNNHQSSAGAGAHSGRRQSVRSLVAEHKRRLVWRRVSDIANDPDQPYNPRLQLLAQRLVTKIGLAAAVPFDIQGSQGLVVYYARAGVSRERLQNPDNETYLVSAANLIGSAYALRKPRQACVSRRHEELQETMARVKRKIRQLGKEALMAKTIREGGSIMPQPMEVEKLEELESTTVATTSASSSSCRDHPYVQFVEHQVVRIFSKFAGGGAQPPPAFNWTQTLWTFVGVLSTLLVLTRTNKAIVEAWGPDHAIVMGPFGALMTLMFGLTGAPASQPRNAILGQTISISIAIGISKFDTLEVWVKQSLAVALSVTTMVKLGVTHPPAGAASLLFASGAFGWFNLLSVLLGNVMAIVAATIINDTNPERQYPTYWGALHYYRVARNVLSAHKKGKELMEKEVQEQSKRA